MMFIVAVADIIIITINVIDTEVHPFSMCVNECLNINKTFTFQVEMIADHIGMVYSGLGPDYRLLVKRARKIAQQYALTYEEPIPTTQLVQKVHEWL